MTKRILVCLISFFLLFSSTVSSVHAAVDFPQATDGQVTEALARIVPIRIVPDNPLYFLITIKETLLRATQPSSAKRAEFDMILSGKRLKESYLLLTNKDVSGASLSLTRYSQRLAKMTDGLGRAKSQNQDVGNLIGEIADNLRNQEVLFFAIKARAEGLGNGGDFAKNYNSAAAAFVDAINSLDNFRPGIRDRFKSATGSANSNRDKDLINSAPKTPGFIEASPEVKPNKIIY